VPDPDPQLEAAIAAINDPERLKQAQDLVTRAAPGLQQVLNAALSEGGWFDTAHNAAVGEAISHEDRSCACAPCARCSPRRRGWACSSGWRWA